LEKLLDVYRFFSSRPLADAALKKKKLLSDEVKGKDYDIWEQRASHLAWEDMEKSWREICQTLEG